MLAEAFLLAVVRQIVRKIHVCNILRQIAGVGEVQDVGVFLAVPFGIGFCQLALANTGNAMEKDLTVSQQHIVNVCKFLISSAEVAARFRNSTIHD